MSTKINLGSLGSYVKNINILPLIISLVAMHISLIFSALRSRYYFLNNDLKLRRSFIVPFYYVGTMFNVILPGGIGGDGYKVYLINKLEKFSKIKALRILFYERVNGFYPLCFLGLLIMLFTSFSSVIQYGQSINIILLILVTPVYFVAAHLILKDEFRVVLGASIYSWMVQIMQVISAIFLIYALYPNASIQLYLDFVFIFIVGSILSIIPISIGGAGLRELSMLYGFQHMDNGSTLEMGVAFATLSFVLYVAVALTGLPFFYIIKSIQRKKL